MFAFPRIPRIPRIPLAVMAVLAVAATAIFSPVGLRAEPAPLRAMTFNLRYASDRPPNSWPERRLAARNAILAADADVVGTQEGLYGQLKDLHADLDGYEWIGLGRNGGSQGEFMAVFYKRARLEPRAFDHFWLSDAPETIGSRSWGNGLPRMLTWVLFEDKASGRLFHFWNTHFDHQSEPARRESAKLVVERIRARDPAVPLILVGDFNQAQGSEVHATLLSSPAEAAAPTLRDAWEIAAGREGEQVGTFHGFRGPETAGDRRIDWILATPDFECVEASVSTYKEGEQYPSDHFPVLAVLSWAEPASGPAAQGEAP